ncbi:zinc finger protein 675-like isoform X2 [Anopheles stephensi]|uniref:zinc finger protein 675-like isoform X2 n=1 Tax=Anopheles stephensi TaxID=30069 RepID=UPI0016589512|nr:zinc finger protein 675-like isoform X2 [Anopheles stephensi]
MLAVVYKICSARLFTFWTGRAMEKIEFFSSVKEDNLPENKAFCRLCLLSKIDEQTVEFCSFSVDVLYERVRQCTGVRVCDACVSQLVSCERFVKQCREVDEKLTNLRQLCKQKTRVATGRTDKPSFPVEQRSNEEVLPVAKVQHSPPKLDEKEPYMPCNGKSNAGDEFYVVEAVDTNHEYDIDLATEAVPGKGNGKAKVLPIKKRSSNGSKNIKRLKCPVCGTMQQRLKQHMLVHTGEKKHVCPVCQKAFSQKGNLTYHMNQHADSSPYGCDQCEKAFKEPQSLRSHKLIHTDERKFRCEVCEETFKYKSSLTVHLRAHTQDKRYSCGECEKSFITSNLFITLSSGLKKHQRTHTGERPYECSECGKSFKASHNLSLHRLSHTKERRFQCDLCESWFSYKNVLKAHMKVHLPKERAKNRVPHHPNTTPNLAANQS